MSETNHNTEFNLSDPDTVTRLDEDTKSPSTMSLLEKARTMEWVEDYVRHKDNMTTDVTHEINSELSSVWMGSFAKCGKDHSNPEHMEVTHIIYRLRGLLNPISRTS